MDQENGRLSCYHGAQTCVDGSWSTCSDGETRLVVDPRDDGYEAFFEREGLALSSPVECDDNPCDPGCMSYFEDPDDLGLGGGPGSGDVPDLSGCAHGLCEEGRGLDADCSACSDTVCALEPGCCDANNPAGWDTDCTTLVGPLCASSAPEVGLCDFAIFAEDSLNLATGGSVLGGSLGAGALVTLQNSNISVDLFSGGSVTLDDGSYSGFVFAGTTVHLVNGASTEANRVHAGVSTSVPVIPERSFSCLPSSPTTQSIGAGANFVTPGDQDTYHLDDPAAVVVLDGPGDYGVIQFNSDSTLVFAGGGTYRLSSLAVASGESTLLVPPGEEVSIETCDGFSFPDGGSVFEYARTTNSCATAPAWSSAPWWYSAGVQVLHNGRSYLAGPGGHDPEPANEPGIGASWMTRWTDQGVCIAYDYVESTNPPQPHAVRFYTNATSTVDLGPGILARGSLTAPHATVNLQSGSYHGLVYAEDITTQAGVTVSGAGLGGDACVASLGVANANAVCPVDVIPPLMNEPCVTGRDCQVNHRCSQPASGVTCAHSKCNPGAPLSATCDECVERICAEEPSCCTDQWTNACVEMVATVCDAVCDGYSCLHQACETGAPLEPTCDGCIATVCSTSGFEACCTDNWSFACALEFRKVCGAPPLVTEPTAGGSLCDYSAFGLHELQTQGATLSGGWVGSPASASQNISNSTVNGNATSSGSLNASGSVVSGDLLSGSGSLASGTVLGTIYTGTPPTPTLPDKTLVGCSAYSDPRSGNLSPGTYGDVSVADGEQLYLRSGTYTFNSLTVGTGGLGARLVLPDDGSIVEINVCGDVDFGENSLMSGLTQATAMNVSVYTEGYFAAHGNNTLFGFIASVGSIPFYSGPCYAGDPCDLSLLREASIYIGPDSTVYGVIVGQRRVDVRGGAVIDATGLEEMCELLWDPGTVVSWPMCSVTLTPTLPNEAATCEPNAPGYEDSTCSGYDLALGVPCDEEISVCNHGTAPFSGNVEVGFWDLAAEQLSTESPAPPEGTCLGSMNIAPGTCEILSCPALPPMEQTLMVDPGAHLDECDERRLDNWSYFDGRSCGGELSPRTEVHTYEAVCPGESYPAWGLLTWNATTPGASTVTFSATTAETVSALPSAPAPTVVGIARSGPPDTQACSRSNPAPECPVDLTAELALGTVQEPVLELTIELVGTESPTLHDWRITYSCIIDQ